MKSLLFFSPRHESSGLRAFGELGVLPLPGGPIVGWMNGWMDGPSLRQDMHDRRWFGIQEPPPPGRKFLHIHIV